ncbi:MAG: zinc-ribbon domain-containing protein [Vicinamibacteria bacterium]
MQASCPHCTYKIVIDDARVPERAFSVKCPKCQNAVKFPGKAAGSAAAAEPPEPASAGPVLGFDSDAMKAQMMAQLRREMGGGAGEVAHAGERALVGLPGGQAGNAALMLTRLGYAVDTVDDSEDAIRLLEQSSHVVVLTAPVAGAQGKESLYQRACRLGAEARRRIFLVVAADNVKSGDGSQAFVLQADLVLTSKDVAGADVVFRNTLAEKRRVYQVFLEARTRADKEAGYI